ncbi:DNA mismatch repair protein MutS [Pullulanibacillus sp. KACC 23026]|uniref:DNA mismatch repair protein MutS n=1 Tax=Pullulanibacillus sp. KACC 23026 TaxID=3028315 RepID=UPI0023B088D1|nr:DNA mismatch repair protein MutS [Pullulanibacillus sp. KACC 23026]WEG11543.1 DNA mismatch repair protein MutS [Pullulanibacillus sp. KACC 23026]
MAFTPMIEQYLSIKKDYADAFLFFRLGDFYEMFFEDAIRASKELEITLTSRDGGSTERIPMCGVPYHSAQSYITLLVEKGYKVAICEQVEDPKAAKGVVKREVVQLVSPGTIMEGGLLQPKENNYLASLSLDNKDTFGLALIDLSTGEGKVTQLHEVDQIMPELMTYNVKELVLPVLTEEEKRMLTPVLETSQLTFSVQKSFEKDEAFTHLYNDLLEQAEEKAYVLLLNYLQHTQKRALEHLQPVERYQVKDYMRLNRQTRRNLELTSSLREKKKHGSLLWLLDRTMTAMGGRKLKAWIEKPLIQLQPILDRLHAVEALKEAFFEREGLREALSNVYDLERLVGRIAYGNVNARELIQLKESLRQIPSITNQLSQVNYEPLKQLAQRIDPCQDIFDLIEKGVMEDPPISVTEGNIIKDGYHQQLDEYRDVTRNGKAWLAALEKKEREETGIKSLKIGFNKVFGYYIEVTRANLRALPEGRYERKQTLANAERFITPELKEKERLILEAEDRKMDLEYQLFQEIRERIKQEASRLQAVASELATLDVLQSFASVSDDYHYVKPEFKEERAIHLVTSRHPVVEKVLSEGEFVANDVEMPASCQIQLITGPNMGGKSTYMRQIALTVIMAQIGCFVPADQASLPIFDQIFTRIGATDDLASGQSTFMVEMVEAKEALAQATENSLILLDEIGRGTSTYDGIAIAQAIVEYIHNHIHAKTLFSTHYHELTSLEQQLEHLVNVHVSAMEQDGSVVFLHKVKKGYADKSYGIHVAELAELPPTLITRAAAILKTLETPDQQVDRVIKKAAEPLEQLPEVREADGIDSAVDSKADSGQLTLFGDLEVKEPKPGNKASELERRIKELDLLNMTPMEAMNVLYDCQMALRNHRRAKSLTKG